jgi:hypothetical protein
LLPDVWNVCQRQESGASGSNWRPAVLAVVVVQPEYLEVKGIEIDVTEMTREDFTSQAEVLEDD